MPRTKEDNAFIAACASDLMKSLVWFALVVTMAYLLGDHSRRIEKLEAQIQELQHTNK